MNDEGIEIISADPVVYKNTITKNNMNGNFFHSSQDFSHFLEI